MKAMVQDRYGSPDVLALRDIPAPRIGAREVLVRVRVASLNALDWHITRGMPRFLRLLEGVRRPRVRVRGVDLAGIVETVGSAVTRFKAGDRVFGAGRGTLAEFAGAREAHLALTPAGITDEQAATCNVAGLTALQGLRDRAGLRSGQRVLIIGAGGGVGTYAVQLAKWLGAEVTAVTRTESAAMVGALGADLVLDHSKEDFTRRAERYDVVFDIGGGRRFTEIRRIMSRRGALVAVGGPAGRWLAPADRMLKAALLSPFASQRFLPFVARHEANDLAILGDLISRGTLRPVIDREYRLEQAPEAIRYLGIGHPRGKVIVGVAAA